MSTHIEGEDSLNQLRAARWFERAITLYLGTPVFLFLLNWLNAGAALFSTLLLGFAIYSSWHSELFSDASQLLRRIKENIGENKVAYAVVFFWCCFSGIGGAGFQNTDYAASNALLKDLIENEWPLTLSEKKPLVYYVPYYLPAAIIGKLFNWHTAQIAIFVWSYLGLTLMWNILSAALDLKKNSNLRVFLAVSMFILFGGWDILGVLLNDNYVGAHLGTHIEWWPEIAQFSSHTTLLFWVPQHAIAPWILTSYILFLLNKKHSSHSILLYAAYSFLWSPIASLGLLPFIAILLVREFNANHMKLFKVTNNFFIAPTFALLGLLFYSSNSIQFPHHWQLGEPNFFERYLQLVLLEILPLALPFLLQNLRQKLFLNQITLPPPFKLSHTEKLLGWTSISILFLLPLYKMGIMNDLAMRASIPALLVLCGFYLKILRAEFSLQFKQIIPTAVCIVIGSGSAISEIYRSVQYFSFRAPSLAAVGTLRNQEGNATVEQRAGNADSLFWQWLGPVTEKTQSTLSE